RRGRRSRARARAAAPPPRSPRCRPAPCRTSGSFGSWHDGCSPAGVRERQRAAGSETTVEEPPGARAGEHHVSVAVADEGADVVAVVHVGVALVDLGEVVLAGDELVELELALLVQAQQAGDVEAGVGRTEDRADQLLLLEGEVE